MVLLIDYKNLYAQYLELDKEFNIAIGGTSLASVIFIDNSSKQAAGLTENSYGGVIASPEISKNNQTGLILHFHPKI